MYRCTCNQSATSEFNRFMCFTLSLIIDTAFAGDIVALKA